LTNNIVAFDFNGVKVIKDSNTELIRLLRNNAVEATETLVDQRDVTNYQVPTGKKATVIFFETQTDAGGNQTLIRADNEDGTTNSVVLLGDITSGIMSNKIFISAEVPADKWINSTHTGAANVTYDLWIIEENA